MKEHDTAPKAQVQSTQPGDEFKMDPLPDSEAPAASKKKLESKVAIVTGGDSGIGRAVAVAFAREGASLCISYLNEEEDAVETERLIREAGGECMLVPGDISDDKHCEAIVSKTMDRFGKIDILVNNA